MKISQIYIYPVKSLRGCSVSSATLTAQGLAYDRKYMLVRVQAGDKTTYQSLSIGRYDALCLFSTALHTTDTAPESFRITYHQPASTAASNEENGDTAVKLSVDVPVAAEYGGLQTLDVDLHGSRCVGYDMGREYEDFFTRWLGFVTKLVYIGGSTREVLGNLAPNKVHVTPGSPAAWSVATYATAGIAIASGLVGSIWTRAWALTGNGSSDGINEEEYTIGFSDCAQLLVTSQVSLEQLNSVGKQAVPLDMSKMRPNIVLAPSQDDEISAFEEDFWSELTVRHGEESVNATRILLTANCGRCKSLNVDYGTGKQVPVAEQMLKRLADMKRRVDAGHGYSPIFGRYGFIDKSSRGRDVAVGDLVDVARRNEERTVFCECRLSRCRCASANHEIDISLAGFINLSRIKHTPRSRPLSPTGFK
ncbi:hypothetical protein ABW21_db0202941 [Orbilia brochopaga]|nr:hypothetical protein ABW21_db0202941 [Drechslerella brochopaga]